jgi:hypothetical protein|tara:strand:+ start:256 stop:528 length:273 start_codon:yes stop_codon:yes gene_type:complete
MLETFRCGALVVLSELALLARFKDDATNSAELRLLAATMAWHSLSLMAILFEPAFLRPAKYWTELVEPSYEGMSHGVAPEDDEDIDSDEA